MSVRQLARLLESGEYERCLSEAAALLQEGEEDAEGLARIYSAICRSRLELKDYIAAVEAGDQALPLAAEAEAPDLLGFILVDLATALVRLRQFDQALERFGQFWQGLAGYTAARCLEGTVRQREGEALWRCGRIREAVEDFRQGREWFLRYGDEQSAAACGRSLVRLHLEMGQWQETLAWLEHGDRYAADNPWDRRFLCAHLLDRAQTLLAMGEVRRAAEEGFRALEAADERLDQQTSSQLFLAECARAENKLPEALSFVLAARVSAIDGRLYDLEFEASDLLFRLLRGQGAELLRDVEASFREAGVDIYQYLSEPAVRRMWQAN